MTMNHVVRQAQFLTQDSHFIFEQFPKRFDQSEFHACGKTSDVVVRLDRHGRSLMADTFNHVGIKRALDQVTHVADLQRFAIKRPDELTPDDPTFFLRIGRATQCPQELA